MKAVQNQLLTFLEGKKQFLVPIYQRPYSWENKHCKRLWEDIVRTGSQEDIPGHFIGSVVYITEGLYQVSTVPSLLVIDGQQRLTTLTLILCALADAIDHGSVVQDLSSDEVRDAYLVNPHQTGSLRHKLILTESDRQTLESILQNKELPDKAARRIVDNYEFFRQQISGGSTDLDALFKGIAKLLMVDIALDRGFDNPQLIFESLNSTGLELSQADLVRNYVLMGLEPQVQTELYQDHWYPVQEAFGHGEHVGLFDRFMRDYLTIKNDAIPNIREVYDTFKAYMQTHESTPVHDTVSEIHGYSRRFRRLAFYEHPDKEVRNAIRDINALKVNVAYPFLMELLRDHEEEVIGHSDLLTALRFVESYVLRRAICGIATNALSKVFAALHSEIDTAHYLESLSAVFLLKDSNQRYPTDEEFRAEFHVKDLYNLQIRNYLLRKLENHARKEPIEVADYTIEHIMPQNDDMPAAWREELGPAWETVYAKYLHTIGNLTLTGYNSEMSDHPFSKKRDM